MGLVLRGLALGMALLTSACGTTPATPLRGEGLARQIADDAVAFNEAYERQHSSLAPEWRHRAHNQYLTLLISFGIIGLVWSLLSWWWPGSGWTMADGADFLWMKAISSRSECATAASLAFFAVEQ